MPAEIFRKQGVCNALVDQLDKLARHNRQGSYRTPHCKWVLPFTAEKRRSRGSGPVKRVHRKPRKSMRSITAVPVIPNSYERYPTYKEATLRIAQSSWPWAVPYGSGKSWASPGTAWSSPGWKK